MSLSEAAPAAQPPRLSSLSSNGRRTSSSEEVSSTPPISPEIEVKVEATMSPNLAVPGNPGSSSESEKRIQNNNTSSYASGGRLKFFKEGRCLLELTHKSNTEGTEHWVPISKKVYWPPRGPVNAESSPSVQSASEAGSDVGSSIPSPWQPGMSSLASAPPSTSALTTSSHLRASRKERSSKPVAFRKQPLSVTNELCFGMKPPPCIVSLRKKVRNLRRKRRQPFHSIVVGAFIMRLEAQAVKSRPPRRPIEMDRIKKASRLEGTVTKLTTLASKKNVQVQIGAWKMKKTQPLVQIQSSTQMVTKVKSELCPVTETCTAASLPAPTSVTATPKQQRVKAEKTVSLSTGNLLSSNHSSAKTLPITPTLARIKREGLGGVGHASAELNLISPDLHRVKVEIGHSPFSYRGSPADMPRLPTSPVPHPRDVRDGQYISPRKRSILREFENGSPSIKRHRLSTDSRGSSSEGGGAGSPASALTASPPRHNNNGGGGGRVSSFSIDSIMSSSSSGGVAPTLHRPVAIPASPAHLRTTPSKSPARSLSPVSTPAPVSSAPPLVVPITPYQSRATPSMPLDPRLAHLAGLSADPRHGLTPVYPQSPHMAAAQYLAFAQQYAMALSAAVTTPTTSMSAATPLLPPVASNGRSSSVSSRQSDTNVSTPPPSAVPPTSTPSRPFSPWKMQYRGEPKAATPTRQTAEVPVRNLASEADMPLNLCVKK